MKILIQNGRVMDPATGTGTYICELLEHFRGQPKKLEHKYRHELHANEVAILPYYVANLNIEATFDWDDVGSWISISKYLPKYGEENRSNSELTEIDSENNIVFNARPGSRITLLGVDDLIVVQTEDSLLVANRHQADAIKNLSPLLPKELL